MPEHLRVDRQEVLTVNDDKTNSQNLSSLPQVDNGIKIGGSWYPAMRSLASSYGIPGRGTAEHGTDSEVKSLDYLPDQSGAAAPMRDDPGDTAPDFTDLMLDADPYTPNVQVPVLVSVVPAPKVAVTKATRFLTPFDGYRTNYITAALSGPDLSNVYALAADPTRTRVTVRQFSTYISLASRNALYYFAMSHDPMFTDYTVLENSTAASFAAPFTIENCTNPLYFTIMPIAAYDPTKANFTGLSLIVETSTIANANPAV